MLLQIKQEMKHPIHQTKMKLFLKRHMLRLLIQMICSIIMSVRTNMIFTNLICSKKETRIQVQNMMLVSKNMAKWLEFLNVCFYIKIRRISISVHNELSNMIYGLNNDLYQTVECIKIPYNRFTFLHMQRRKHFVN